MNEKNGDDERSIESEEEDYEIYFLQPSSSPYNMKEKLEEANKALVDDHPLLEDRPSKVKFKEKLVDYEPDLTDDDVQSIESYNEIDYMLEQEFIEEIAPQQLPNKIELNIFTPCLNVTEEEDEEDDSTSGDIVSNEELGQDNEESNLNQYSFVNERQGTLTDKDSITDEEIEEKIDSSEMNTSEETVGASNSSSNLSDSSIYDEEVEVIHQTDSTETKEETTTTKTASSASSKRTVSILSRRLSKVDCKIHCIERLDTQIDLTISKLQISERPLCPTLKLLKRKCCEKNQAKNEQKLPCYTGLRSEYGLSLQQLEKRQRRKELLKMREEKRKRLMEEYKSRKIQQNEEIFSQWLRNIQKRKEEQVNRNKNGKKAISPKILEIPNKQFEKMERPKTSYPLITNHGVRKLRRPNTSTACVFIQVPQNVLRKGLHVGDIIVTSSKNVPSPNGLHILSIS
ncbi:hypothetical protein Trydic_g5921 [Trypoxylus dichotomus]